MPKQLNHFSKLDLLLLKLLVFRVFSLNLKEFRVSVFCTLVLYFLISFIVQFSRIFCLRFPRQPCYYITCSFLCQVLFLIFLNFFSKNFSKALYIGTSSVWIYILSLISFVVNSFFIFLLLFLFFTTNIRYFTYFLMF